MQNKAIFLFFILAVIFFKLPSQEDIDLKHLEAALNKGEVSGIKVVYEKDPFFYFVRGNSHVEIFYLKVDRYALRDKAEQIYSDPDFPECNKVSIVYQIEDDRKLTNKVPCYDF